MHQSREVIYNDRNFQYRITINHVVINIKIIFVIEHSFMIFHFKGLTSYQDLKFVIILSHRNFLLFLNALPDQL